MTEALKAVDDAPFSPVMSAISDAMSMGRIQIAVARKQLDAIEQQGKDALKLISAALPVGQGAPTNVAPGVGGQLNVVA